MNDFTDVLCDGRHLYMAVRDKLMQTLEWRRDAVPVSAKPDGPGGKDYAGGRSEDRRPGQAGRAAPGLPRPGRGLGLPAENLIAAYENLRCNNCAAGSAPSPAARLFWHRSS